MMTSGHPGDASPPLGSEGYVLTAQDPAGGWESCPAWLGHLIRAGRIQWPGAPHGLRDAHGLMMGFAHCFSGLRFRRGP